MEKFTNKNLEILFKQEAKNFEKLILKYYPLFYIDVLTGYRELICFNIVKETYETIPYTTRKLFNPCICNIDSEGNMLPLKDCYRRFVRIDFTNKNGIMINKIPQEHNCFFEEDNWGSYADKYEFLISIRRDFILENCPFVIQEKIKPKNWIERIFKPKYSFELKHIRTEEIVKVEVSEKDFLNHSVGDYFKY